MAAIGIDLGGTNIRAGLVDKNGTTSSIVWRRTPVDEGPEATARAMAEMVAEICRSTSSRPLGVGIGSPGPLSRQQKMIFQSPNLPGFDGFPLGQRVEELCGLAVELDNDAKCSTYGEALFGAARGMRDFVLLTFGTGIGGGILVNGEMLYGKSDGGAEMGHLTLYPEGLLCKCGNRGCFELYCSATAAERRASEAAGQPVSGKEIFAALTEKKSWAETSMRAFALDLSYACATIVNVFDPEAIVFAGGLFTTGGGPLCDWVSEGIRDRCFKSSQKNLRILPSALHGEAGIMGAASIVYRQHASR